MAETKSSSAVGTVDSFNVSVSTRELGEFLERASRVEVISLEFTFKDKALPLMKVRSRAG
jgi:hypothetical protein